MRPIIIIPLVLLLGGCLSSPAPQVVYHPAAPLNGQAMPFSEAVRVGSLLFVAGQLGNVPGTRTIVPGGIATESRQALENLKAVLERHGSSLDNVVKTTVLLGDISEWAAFNEVYVQYFKGNMPARCAFGVGELAWGARVEVECIAVVPGAAQ